MEEMTEQIKSMFSNLDPTVFNKNFLLLLYRESAISQFDRQRILIDRFKEARTELAVNVNCSTDNLFR